MRCHRKRRSLLKNILATAFCACLLGIVFSGAGVCQTPGYGDKPDQWAPYESGQYFEQLQKIISIYQFADSKITYLRFEITNVGVGPVELFRIPVGRSRDCSEKRLLFFCACCFRPQRRTAFDPMSIQASRPDAFV
jgi:hypothetical protein